MTTPLRIRFTKAEGAQNDFLIVEDLEAGLSREQRAEFTRVACHRRRGVGGDGAIFIERGGAGDFVMDFYNPDGSRGSMCGNGGRAAARYAHACGIAGAHMRFEVLGRMYEAHVFDDGVRLFFPPPLRVRTGLRLDASFGDLRAHFVHNGAPHLVCFVDDLPDPVRAPLDTLDLSRIGAELRAHESWAPEGANVNLLAPVDDGWHIRTFEKGVEAETQACGTGALASGMIAHAVAGAEPPVALRTRGGDLLYIDFRPRRERDVHDPAYFAEGLSLEGPARLVFDGTWVMDATA